MKKGRPTLYTIAIAEAICEEIAKGKSLVNICKDMGLTYSVVMVWLNVHLDFQDKYVVAREQQADYLADEILEIADNCTDDIALLMAEHSAGDGSRAVIKQTAISRARLQIDARKWIASKLKPKKYGERVTQTMGIDPELPKGKMIISWES